MSLLTHNKNLKENNTFGIEVNASHFAEVENDIEIIQLTNSYYYNKCKHLIIGMGANILFTSDFDGLVIKSNIKHIEIEKEDQHFVHVKVGSGVVWNDFVHYALERNWYGIENLIDIPGLCGGAIVQNIGAYGVEISSVVERVRAYRMEPPRSYIELSKDECKFSYRHSIFKEPDYSNRYFITEVTFKLPKDFIPNIEYKGVKQALAECRIGNPTAKGVAHAISYLRQNKLPDYHKIGSAGSFFKNPIVVYEDYKDIIGKYNLTTYPVNEEVCKLSAAQLIELAGFKGRRNGDAGVYSKHSLILCNYGNATGENLFQLALQIVEQVNYMFGIKLTPEVIVW